MANTGTLLLAGVTILPNNQPDFSKVADIFMMTIGGGKRTESEFRELLGKAGFQSLRSILPNPCCQLSKSGQFNEENIAIDVKCRKCHRGDTSNANIRE